MALTVHLAVKTQIPFGLLKGKALKKVPSWFFKNVLHFWNCCDIHVACACSLLQLVLSRCSVWACSLLCAEHCIQHWTSSLIWWTWLKDWCKNYCCLCFRPSGRVEKYSPLLNICFAAVAKLSNSPSVSSLTALYLVFKKIMHCGVCFCLWHVPCDNNNDNALTLHCVS